jgi:excisionase family DNA binding protein
MNGTQPELVSVKTLSHLLDIPVWTLRKWVAQRKIRYRKLGRLVRFDVGEIRTWCAANAVDPISHRLNDLRLRTVRPVDNFDCRNGTREIINDSKI